MSKKSAELQAVQRTDMTRRQWIWKEMKNNKYIVVVNTAMRINNQRKSG